MIVTKLAHYEITSHLGTGGMGEVYEATDTKLGRSVALKLLPEAFSHDSDRVARFEREARVLASLNHPNIAAIYGVEESEGRRFIVMERVPGETLAERIRRGELSVDESLSIATQIAEALEAAHEKGVIHRDLKPGNVMLTGDGKVKVLDFGLAKAFEPDPSSATLSNSPTMTSPAATNAGVILGTAAYMSPEQARGKTVDRRTDIFAFGCVLYEMLAGVRAFKGDDVTEILGAIIHKEPEWDRIPERARFLVRRCLEKNTSRRLKDIGDAMSLLGLAPGAPVGTSRPSLVARMGWPAAVLFALTAVAVSSLYFLQESPPAPGVMTFEIPPPPDAELDAINVVISPNGRLLAFVARSKDNISRLWIRNVESTQAHSLVGTEGSQAPIWSPDSRFIAFGTGNQLKKIDVSGGAVVTLGASATAVGSGSWGKNGIIVFGGRGVGTIQQIPASGGVPQHVTRLGEGRVGFHTFPSFLPDGRHFLYMAAVGTPHSGVYLGSLDATPEQQETNRVLEGTSNAMYVPGPDPAMGYLLYTRNATLMAQPFDPNLRQLQGDAVPIADQVSSPNPILGIFSASTNGVLAYRGGGGAMRTLVLRERTNRDTVVAPNPMNAQNPRLSPDGKRLALIVEGDLWVYDLEGRPPIKLTFGRRAYSPLWTRDGKRLIFETNVAGEAPDTSGAPVKFAAGSLLSVASDGSSSAAVLASPPGHFHAYGWSASGELIVADYRDENPTRDISKFLPDPKAQPAFVVQTPAAEGAGGLSLSPDGLWLAYVSNATGGGEIWVKSFGGSGAPIRVSPSGGEDPIWARNGKELFYVQANRLMSIEVDTRSGFTFRPPVVLFEVAPIPGQQPPSYDVTADGRFVLLRSSTSVSTPVTLVLNWTSKLKK